MNSRRTSTHVGFRAVAVAATAAVAVVVEVLDSILLLLAIDQSRIVAGRGKSSGAWLESFSLLVRSDAVTCWWLSLLACLLLAFLTPAYLVLLWIMRLFCGWKNSQHSGLFRSIEPRVCWPFSERFAPRVSLWGPGLRRWLYQTLWGFALEEVYHAELSVTVCCWLWQGKWGLRASGWLGGSSKERYLDWLVPRAYVLSSCLFGGFSSIDRYLRSCFGSLPRGFLIPVI